MTQPQPDPHLPTQRLRSMLNEAIFGMADGETISVRDLRNMLTESVRGDAWASTTERLVDSPRDVTGRLQWAYDHRDHLIEGDPIAMFDTLTGIAAEAWNQLRDERMRRAADERAKAVNVRAAES